MDTNETAIRALVEDIVNSSRSTDPNALAALYASDVIAFDVVNPLQYAGSDAVAKRAQEWFSSWQGDFTYEVRDLSIAAAGDVAFCHSLNHVNGMKTDGHRVDMWWRATLGCRKVGDRWTVTHAHNSVPFNMETGKASLDITP